MSSSMDVSYTPPNQLTCYASSGYAFIDSAGTQYSFGNLIGYFNGPKVCTGYNSVTSQNLDFYSASIGSQANSYPLKVTSLDNTTYTFSVGDGGGCVVTNGGAGSLPPSTIEDRNGNIIKITVPANTCTGTFTATDTLDRTVLSSSGFGVTGNTITVSGLTQPYTLTWGTTSPTYNPGSTLVITDGWCNTGFTGARGPYPVVTAITLPNGKQYTFSYDATYGLISKITYPTGGYVSYTWGLNSRSDFVAVQDSNGANQQCGFTYDSPALTHRYVSYDGSTIAEQQDFTNYTTTWNPSNSSVWTSKTTTVTTHDLVNGTSFQTSYTYSPEPVSTGGSSFLPSRFGTQAPVEQTIVYRGTSGNTLRTVNKTWHDQFEILTDQTTLDTGQSSQVNFTWGGGLITEKDELDFGQSTPTRKTLYTYGGGFSQPCQTIVEDGNSNHFSETDTYFDNVTTLCALPTAPVVTAVSNLPTGTHDETNYGPLTCPLAPRTGSYDTEIS
jgi:YD repeat-containing protein